MNIDSKIWATTNTGTKFHAFRGEGALCRKNLRPRAALHFESDDCKRTLSFVKGRFSESDVCTACEAKALTHEAFLDSEHAIALAMNAEIDAKAVPVCICPRLEPPAKFGHHVACPLRAEAAPACICPVRTDYHSLDCMTFRAAHSATDTHTEENDNVSIKEGPLTERQIHILNHLRAGKRHEEIAKAWATVPGGDGEPRTITVSVVKQECQTITAKFGASTVMQAVSLWATAQAYREAATLIDSHRSTEPDNEVDQHVDYVLNGLAQILRDRADRLTPR